MNRTIECDIANKVKKQRNGHLIFPDIFASVLLLIPSMCGEIETHAVQNAIEKMEKHLKVYHCWSFISYQVKFLWN